jgi:hypothetical protein
MDGHANRFEISFAPKEGDTVDKVNPETAAEVARVAETMAIQRGGKSARWVGSETRGNLIVWAFEVVVDEAAPPPADADRQVDRECALSLRAGGFASPRTCPTCGLGPCTRGFAKGKAIEAYPPVNGVPPLNEPPQDEVGSDAGIAQAIRDALASLVRLARLADERGIEVDFSINREGLVDAEIRRPL